ncbi:dihydrolipoamide succinyltransferase [Rhodomicrobium udaipurense JA643]|uniref:Dihydrolipoyllysine-residue succinyltransferase component of 2-oxoglutarate dehydrogenase complex n=1 Tax=Rhodomicrobium udaipurense TaxID=1202716 RepID=A0A8I1KJ55_9HYPH|nr:2-oxoglutarate dehydrogenase complex dihydrolipoyllysine-residue succinyltransferase [Rhodomicrobium udaipurense]KAI94342.1 dihydrolipoamide succinyltransferase [Rhodomicrobium udaipurense JA643]MBJ7543387.1 2-oxoglutarate dehydrogenase complex dihydrolipoyllysine-residue succinyltransferase [Rhodomicrobium udaipurense]
MTTEIVVPTLGESVTEATVGRWFKKPGEAVKADEALAELETDKVTLEVNAPAAGVIAEILVKEGETVGVGALLGTIAEGAAAAAMGASKPAEKPAQAQVASAAQVATPSAVQAASPRSPNVDVLAPSVRRIAEETGINPATVSGTGKDGRVTKGDMLSVIEGGAASASAAPSSFFEKAPSPAPAVRPAAPRTIEAREERVRMTKLRQTIARRLKEAQNNAAMLTTFNEVDMSTIMDLRNRYKTIFEKKHGTKLGFMGFFVKAVLHALHDVPSVNAEIDGDDIIYKNFYHIGIAVGTDRGLVVPVVRDADHKSVAEIEKEITGFGVKARDGKLSLEEMQGGTFTISNGGVYGSLMSTPILNAPQSGILGMHKIQERPVVVNGKIEIRPMMYLALSYDHRLVDGKEAVTFLVHVKDALEDPQRLILDL